MPIRPDMAMFRLILILSAFVLQTRGYADSVVGAAPQDQFEPSLLTGGSPTANSPTFKLLHCVLNNAPEKLYSNPNHNGEAMAIKAFAVPLDASFIRHGMNDTEQAMFLSQAIVESRFFTQMTETKNLGNEVNDVGQMIKATDTPKLGLKTNKVAGDYVGRGMLQITGYDNQLAAVDYFAQTLDTTRQSEPTWVGGWVFPYDTKKRDPKTKKPIIEQRLIEPNENNPEVLRQFKKWYASDKKRDINYMGLMDSPERWALPDMPIEYESGGKKHQMNSSSMVTGLAMSYWEGRCRGEMAKLAASDTAKSAVYGPSSFNGHDEYRVAAATKCVKGVFTKKDVAIRTEWYKIIRECQAKPKN